MRKVLRLLHVLALLKDIWCKDKTRTTVNAEIGETVILPCDVDGPVFTLRWLKSIDILVQDFEVNTLITGHDRLKIDTNKSYNLGNVSVYNLIISNVTSDNFGEYCCVLQGLNTEENYIYLTQATGRNSKITKGQTEIEDMRNLQNASLEQDVKYYGYLESTTRTERTSKLEEIVHRREIDGVSLREMFYYGLLLAGLILVISFSISINVHIIRKCKFRENSNTAHGRHLNQIEENVQDEVEVNVPEEDGTFYSQYETINESEMIQLPVVQHFDTIESNITTNTLNTDLYQRQVNATSADMRTSSSSLQDHSNTNSTINSDSLSDDSKPGPKNGYLNKYVQLNRNEMEYLHSYSGLVRKEDVCPST